MQEEDTMADDLVKQFADDVVNEDLWLFTAQQLLASAALLEPHIETKWSIHKNHMFKGGPEPIKDGLDAANFQMVYLMLAAYAIENILKSFIVTVHKQDIHDKALLTRKLPDILKNHNLVELGKHANSNTAMKEEELLRRLTLNAVWAGRYPMGTSAESLASTEKFSNGKHQYVVYWTSDDIVSVKTLINKLCLELKLDISI